MLNWTAEMEQTHKELIEKYTEYVTLMLDSKKTLIQQRNLMQVPGDAEILNAINQQIKSLNFFVLFLIAHLDIEVIRKGILISSTWWDKKYYLKQGYLLVYETINTYNSHQSDLNRMSLSAPSETKENFKKASDKLKEFKKNFQYFKMKHIRNKVSAHIEKDMFAYYDALSSIDTENATDAILTFAEILFDFVYLSKDFMLSNSAQLRLAIEENLKTIE